MMIHFTHYLLHVRNKTDNGNGDGGIDLIVQLLCCTVLIQCKNYEKSVGKIFKILKQII